MPPSENKHAPASRRQKLEHKVVSIYRGLNTTDPFGLWPTWDQIASASAGFGDALLFGAGPTLRRWAGADGSVDMHSTAYVGGAIVGGIAVTVATDGVGAGAAADETQVANEGIYEFTATSGKKYVGQSKNIARRLAQHVRSGKLAAGEVGNVSRTEVLGGKLAREIAEQQRIDELGGIQNLENKVNPIGPARQHLLDQHQP